MRFALIEALMLAISQCNFRRIIEGVWHHPRQLDRMYRFKPPKRSPKWCVSPRALEIRPASRPLTRMIARIFDTYRESEKSHSAAHLGGSGTPAAFRSTPAAISFARVSAFAARQTP